MRALPAAGALLLARALCGCGASDAPGSLSDAAGSDAHDASVDSTRDSTPSAWDWDWDTAVAPQPDTSLGPVGRCLYESIDWTCRAGHICTFTGKCTPDDAGPSEAGSEACGIIWCDKQYCHCRTASASLCDCN